MKKIVSSVMALLFLVTCLSGCGKKDTTEEVTSIKETTSTVSTVSTVSSVEKAPVEESTLKVDIAALEEKYKIPTDITNDQKMAFVYNLGDDYNEDYCRIMSDGYFWYAMWEGRFVKCTDVNDALVVEGENEGEVVTLNKYAGLYIDYFNGYSDAIANEVFKYMDEQYERTGIYDFILLKNSDFNYGAICYAVVIDEAGNEPDICIRMGRKQAESTLNMAQFIDGWKKVYLYPVEIMNDDFSYMICDGLENKNIETIYVRYFSYDIEDSGQIAIEDVKYHSTLTNGIDVYTYDSSNLSSYEKTYGDATAKYGARYMSDNYGGSGYGNNSSVDSGYDSNEGYSDNSSVNSEDDVVADYDGGFDDEQQGFVNIDVSSFKSYRGLGMFDGSTVYFDGSTIVLERDGIQWAYGYVHDTVTKDGKEYQSYSISSEMGQQDAYMYVDESAKTIEATS